MRASSSSVCKLSSGIRTTTSGIYLGGNGGDEGSYSFETGFGPSVTIRTLGGWNAVSQNWRGLGVDSW